MTSKNDATLNEPDFAGLFSVCTCQHPECERCIDWQLTPRMASVLWTAAQLLSDDAYDDVEYYGDQEVSGNNSWSLFDLYPAITFRQDANWRRRAALAYDDLIGDLEVGQWPRPRCPAEEMALHQILQHLVGWEQDSGDDGIIHWDELVALPAHEDDRDWDGAYDALLQDRDILELFEPESDGIEDPESEENRFTGMGDYRPAAWFTWFGGSEPRDPSRPFRR